MFRQLNFRSFFNFLGRNKLYTCINIFGLSVSLMFVVLIADYTLRQFTRDNFHTKADRICVLSSEDFLGTAYYLQKHLLDRYPEIEMTCAVVPSGWSSDETEQIKAGTNSFAATALYVDSTFFRMFDFPLLEGDRREALASRDQVVLSESFARKAFGTFNPLGQVIRVDDKDEQGHKREFVVSGVLQDIENSVIPNRDLILRAERITQLNPSNNEQMNNAGAVATFVLVREGADLEAKRADMVTYFKEFYWPYKGNSSHEVLLTPLRELYFSQIAASSFLLSDSWSFVLILLVVGAVILVFAVINYINLTVAQTGFRAREMAMRRLLGSSRGEVMLKLILESTLMCAAAFVVAVWLAVALEPYASQLLESPIHVMADLSGGMIAGYLLLIAALGVVAGFAPALLISRYKPLDVMNGSFRRRTKSVYSNVLITIQNVITVVLLAASLTITLQIRHLINTPLGYNTTDILNIPSEIFGDYNDIRRFRDELRQLPCVESVALGRGTPHDGGNNNTMQYGPERMISFLILIGDSVYFRMLGLEVLREYTPNTMMLNQYAFRELEIPEDATNFKVGKNKSKNYDIGGIVRDFQMRSALDGECSVMLTNVGDFDRFLNDGKREGPYPWQILVKVLGDHAAAYEAIRALHGRLFDNSFFRGKYMEQEIAADYAEQQRLLRIVGVFAVVAILISALGLLAMSTYYIQQKQQEVAVRKVFGSTRSEVFRRLVGHFMRLVGVAFVLAVPPGWYILSRWLEDYSVRIALSPLIFVAAGACVAVIALCVVFWQSRRAANANPIESIKN